MKKVELDGKKALVMGLGLHGGGLESVRYLLKNGAHVTCTDLRDAETLAPSLAALEGDDVSYVLGEHRKEDFDKADIIVKNPAVPANSKWIAGRSNVETDLSLFLRSNVSPLLAVTGSKGKSTVVSALHSILKTIYPDAKLGGNITVNPLSFVDSLTPDTPVVLELSSWQLADLKGRGLLQPQVACITNLMHDHQNRYASFADYEADKKVIFESMAPGGRTVFPDNEFGRKWGSAAEGSSFYVGEGSAGRAQFRLDDSGRGWFHSPDGKELVLPAELKVPGMPFRGNLLFASALATLFGVDSESIVKSQASFMGVPYRMEMFLQKNGVRYYDDTAATIPDAAAAAVRALAENGSPVVLIAGGTDKDLDFEPWDDVAGIPHRIVLLEGSATDAMIPRLKMAGVAFSGPFNSMESAVKEAESIAEPGFSVVLSPGAASFGMFKHEFHRGDAFKEACRKL